MNYAPSRSSPREQQTFAGSNDQPETAPPPAVQLSCCPESLGAFSCDERDVRCGPMLKQLVERLQRLSLLRHVVMTVVMSSLHTGDAMRLQSTSYLLRYAGARQQRFDA